MFFQKITIIVLLIYCITIVIAENENETKDLEIEDSEELERRHRKRRRKGQNNGGCGGYGRTFGEKFFGLHDYTYVSAPVMNYFFGCGVAAVPVAAPVPIAPVAPIAPIQPYPINIGVSQSQSHLHGGLGGQHGGLGGHNGGLGGLGGYGGSGAYGGPTYGGFGGAGNYNGYNQGYNTPGFNQRPFNRPLQNVVSAAASGLGTALADYITNRPRKTYKQLNKQVNQFLKPLYKWF